MAASEVEPTVTRAAAPLVWNGRITPTLDADAVTLMTGTASADADARPGLESAAASAPLGVLPALAGFPSGYGRADAIDTFGDPSFSEQAFTDAGPGLMTRLRTWLEEAFAWLKTLVSAAVYATLIVTFGFQVARVEGQSMAPTLENQDRLIVNKFQYLIDSPRPGDIVMLRYPVDPDKSFVKRVIAEEGDAVRIEDGIVYVNGQAIKDDFVPPAYRSHDDHETEIIKKGYYYVLGDHRNNSSDSREWGLVPKKYIMGRVQLRWWPIPHARVF